MRVLAGKFKNKKLFFPKQIRPSSQLHKKILFDTIRPYIDSSNFLDLYAGSGQIGIEALSQGADYVTFVENNFHSQKAIMQNIASCGIKSDQYLIVKKSTSNFIQNNLQKYSIIYADPPYFEVNWTDFNSIHNLMDEKSILIIKYSPKNIPPILNNLQLFQTKFNSDTNLNFYSL